jgi:hypothetical protein
MTAWGSSPKPRNAAAAELRPVLRCAIEAEIERGATVDADARSSSLRVQVSSSFARPSAVRPRVADVLGAGKRESAVHNVMSAP